MATGSVGEATVEVVGIVDSSGSVDTAAAGSYDAGSGLEAAFQIVHQHLGALAGDMEHSGSHLGHVANGIAYFGERVGLSSGAAELEFLKLRLLC